MAFCKGVATSQPRDLLSHNVRMLNQHIYLFCSDSVFGFWGDDEMVFQDICEFIARARLALPND
jgi:hypothetical protein